MQAFVVRQDGDAVSAGIEPLGREDWPAASMWVRVKWSSVNYKDLMAADGNSGIVKKLPHVPGIDSAGEVLEDASGRFSPGDEVLVTGHRLGAPDWGGWSEEICVPAEWAVPRPGDLSLREAMILGTAGFTAAQAFAAFERNEVSPDDGPIVITGATGGVGSLALMLAKRLGYHAIASTGKAEEHAARLKELGAAEVVDRGVFGQEDPKPLGPSAYAGGIDAVGGRTLVNLIRQTKYRGCVAAYGLVGGTDLPLTVYPFLLRGVTLAGVASADCPMPERLRIWDLLAGRWRLDGLDGLAREVSLEQLPAALDEMRNSANLGRFVVRVS